MARLADLTNRLQAAGAWVFSAGLSPASTATVLRADDGRVAMTADLDAALAWAQQLAEITTLPIEVRPMQAPAIQQSPAGDQRVG
jgi:hypothetical protein